jgi:cobalt-zinc-cadmium efflux system outer membrane protein
MRWRIAPYTALGTGWLLAGCAATQPGKGFDEVRAMVSERSGLHVSWNTASAADVEAAAAVRSLLEHELTADEAAQIALLNNRNLQALYEDLGVAQADLVQAGLLSNPVFNAEIRFFASAPPGVELSVVQDFVDALLIPLRQEVAGAALEAVKVQVSGAVLDVAGEVRASFYELQASEQTREMRETVLQATSSSYELAQRLHQAGNITELDLANERALYEQSNLDLAESEVEALMRRERLNSLMGLWGPDTAWKVAPRLPELPADEIASEGLEKRAVAYSLDLEAARREVEVAAGRLVLARPAVMLAGGNLGATAEGDHPEGFWGVGPAFSLPVPIFDMGQAAVAGAGGAWRGASQRYYALAVEIRARVRAAWNQTGAARSRAEYYAASVLPLRQRIVEETQKEYNAMQVGAFQLLTAKQQEIEAGSQYIRALRDYWLARAELEQILSGGLPQSQAQLSASRRSTSRIRFSAGGTH